MEKFQNQTRTDTRLYVIQDSPQVRLVSESEFQRCNPRSPTIRKRVFQDGSGPLGKSVLEKIK